LETAWPDSGSNANISTYNELNHAAAIPIKSFVLLFLNGMFGLPRLDYNLVTAGEGANHRISTIKSGIPLVDTTFLWLNET
jgi:hypothetical protein